MDAASIFTKSHNARNAADPGFPAAVFVVSGQRATLYVAGPSAKLRVVDVAHAQAPK